MTPDRWIVLIGSLLLITIIIWFLFWLRVPTGVLAGEVGSGDQGAMIAVEDGYTLGTIAVSHKKSVRLAGLNKNANRPAGEISSVPFRFDQPVEHVSQWAGRGIEGTNEGDN